MKIENLVPYSYNAVNEFYSTEVITQAQWEAYDFAWANTHITFFPYYWSSMPQDARNEYWKLYKVLPERLQKLLRPLAIG